VAEALNYWVLQTLAMGVTALLIPRLRITGIFGAFKIVAALAFLNATLWDAALFFSLPEGITTQAALLLGVNGVIFWVLVKTLNGIEVDGFLPAIIAPVVFTGLSLLIDQYGHLVDWGMIYDETVSLVKELRVELGGEVSDLSLPESVKPKILD
jgi:uncharacterized membrane protein YvlD (DUF360 family)